MKSTVKIAFEFNEKDVKNLMLRKGYDEFTKEDLWRELLKLDIEELKHLSFFDSNDKEIIIE